MRKVKSDSEKIEQYYKTIVSLQMQISEVERMMLGFNGAESAFISGEIHTIDELLSKHNSLMKRLKYYSGVYNKLISSAKT